MKKTILLFLYFLLFTIFSLTAQSAEKVDKILESENLSKGQACYLLGSFSGVFKDDVSFEDAFDYYKDLKMFKGESADEDVRLDEFADLILRNIKLKRSFCYIITKSPYYALRHLKRMNIISHDASSSSSIKVVNALNILSKLSDSAESLSKKEEQKEKKDAEQGVENEEN